MKRVVSTILSLMIVFLSMTGCSDKSNNTSPSSMDWTSNPFSTDIIDEGTTLDGGYGFGMINPVEKITYEGNSVEIPFWFKNDVVPIDVGIYIFIDGVAQQYSIKNADESADLLKHISLKKEEQKEITLSFTPSVGKKGDTLELNILTLMNTLYIPQGENKSFGNQHAALPSMPIKLSYQADTVNEYPKIMLNDNMKNISAETIKTYQINTEELANTVRLFDDSENIENLIHFSKGNNFDLSIAAYGNNATKYRTTVFVNHKPIKTVDEISVFDFEIKKDYLSEMKFQVDSNSLDDNNFVYAISVPLTNSTNSRIIKTQSTLLTCQSEAKSPSVQPEKSTSEQTQSIEMNGVKLEDINENGAPFTDIEFAGKNTAYAATSSELLLIDTMTKNVIAKAALPKQMGMRQFYHLDNGVGLAYTTSEAVNKSKEFVVEKALPSNAYYIYGQLKII